MKKWTLALVILAVIAVALGTAGSVYAQSATPQPGNPVNGYGYGAGRGARGGMISGVAGTQDGLLHDELIAAYSAKLGIPVDDLNTRLAAGETLSQIALSTGLTFEQFSTLVKDVRAEVIAQAVAEGTLTQAQADWMNQHAFGAARGGRGMRGGAAGTGLYANPACPYLQTNP